MKISFLNLVANVAETVGADIDQVCIGLGTDTRIGPRFLRAGIGYGGSCFPKDIAAFHAVASQCGVDAALLTEVARINREQQRRFVQKVRSALWTLRGKRVGVLGLAFKDGTDDIRESPAIAIVRELLKEGVSLCAYDPAAMPNARKILPPNVLEYADEPYQAAAGRDALLILTDWVELPRLDLQKLRAVMRLPIILDGRNLYCPETLSAAGFQYHSVGRPATLDITPNDSPFASIQLYRVPPGSCLLIRLAMHGDQTFVNNHMLPGHPAEVVPYQGSGEELLVAEISRTLRKHRLLILGCVLGCLTLAGLYVAVKTRQYEASAQSR